MSKHRTTQAAHTRASAHSEEPHASEVVRRYHTASKHDFARLARNHGEPDWETQPNPFRRYEGAPLLRLPSVGSNVTPPYHQIYEGPDLCPPAPTLRSVAQFFQFSLGVSAWKESHGRLLPVRVNPSSGNLHPTECYVIADSVFVEDARGASAGPAVYHYAPAEHALEVRARFMQETWLELISALPPSSFLLCLTSIHWREIWKYGERAYRYCQHDVGHALASVRISAAALGWQVVLLEDLGDASIARLLGLDHAKLPEAEREHPALAAVVIPNRRALTSPLTLPAGPIKKMAAEAVWLGEANRLSAEHFGWEIINQVADACVKPETNLYDLRPATEIPPPRRPDDFRQSFPPSPSAGHVIWGRRSAVALDGVTEISSTDFYRMLRRVMPRHDGEASSSPWDAFRWETCVHLGLFLHRVSGFEPGIYLLVRDPRRVGELRSHMKPEFVWRRPIGCQADLPLYLLQEGDCQRLSRLLSCGQAVAADGALSLAMLAEFERPLRRFGAWHYRRLFWEAGLIGHVLYLEAEASWLRGTGIGCFFDNATHEVFGLTQWHYQSIYNFTIGGCSERRMDVRAVSE